MRHQASFVAPTSMIKITKRQKATNTLLVGLITRKKTLHLYIYIYTYTELISWSVPSWWYSIITFHWSKRLKPRDHPIPMVISPIGTWPLPHPLPAHRPALQVQVHRLLSRLSNNWDEDCWQGKNMDDDGEKIGEIRLYLCTILDTIDLYIVICGIYPLLSSNMAGVLENPWMEV